MLLQDFYVNGKKLRLRKFLSQREITTKLEYGHNKSK